MTLHEEVAAIVRKAAKLPGDIQFEDSDNLITDVGLDSLDALQIALDLEKTFDISIEPEALPQESWSVEGLSIMVQEAQLRKAANG